MTTVCAGDPLTCCQREPMSEDAWLATLDRVRRADAAFRAEIPSRCGWCGGRSVPPVYATNRRTWICLDCKREFSPGATG